MESVAVANGTDGFVEIKTKEDETNELPFANLTAHSDNKQQLAHPEATGTKDVTTDSLCVEGERTDFATPQADEGERNLTSLGGFASWFHPGMVHILQHCGNFLCSRLPETPLPQYFNQVQAAMCRVDWTGVAYNASIALLSTLLLGLLIENRRMGHEVKKKQEEIKKLMMALMNFQEMWSPNRAARVPILRHTGLTHSPYHPY